MSLHMRNNAAGQIVLILVALVLVVVSTGAAQNRPDRPSPRFSNAVAFDVSPSLRHLAQTRATAKALAPSFVLEVRPERGPVAQDKGFSGDGAQQLSSQAASAFSALAIPSPLTNFEGLSNQDNFNIFGGRVNPPDPVGDVGPNHYVEMINLVFGVYDKQGNLLLGPVDTGTLWAEFAVPDCTEPSGDPIVLYDQFMDRWLLSQFTTSGLSDPTKPFWNCVAISTSGDPTGTYYRYAFETAHFQFFPDYPKYGVWTDSYVLTTREFGPTVEYGIGVYALEKNKMVNGQPDARAVSFFIDGNVAELLPLVGDGLLPADIDGKQKPKTDTAIPLVGTQDDGGGYGATFDALNIWDLIVKWRSTPTASLTLAAQLPTAAFIPSSLALRRPATACRSRGSSIRRSTWTSCPTGSGQPGGWRIATSRTTRRWSPISRWRPYPESPECAGTRSGEPAPVTRFISRAPMRPMTACIAGWVAPPRTGKATSRWSIAW